MKIRFVDGNTTIKRLNGIIQEENGFRVANVGKYYYNTKQIIIVRQEYWYITFFILTHELMHWIIYCIFPHKICFLHKWLDKYWKIPKIWTQERSFLCEAFRLNSSNISQIFEKEIKNDIFQ